MVTLFLKGKSIFSSTNLPVTTINLLIYLDTTDIYAIYMIQMIEDSPCYLMSDSEEEGKLEQPCSLPTHDNKIRIRDVTTGGVI